MAGLLRGIARTAVISGTATAVSGRVARRQAARYAEQDAETAFQRQQAYESQQGPQARQVVAAPESSSNVLEQLKTLAELKAQGILTDDEFAAQKARILGG
jgi:hypothetical protein